MQYFFIVVAPVLLAAGIYVNLSKLIALLGREYSPILSPKQILSIFITADVVADYFEKGGDGEGEGVQEAARAEGEVGVEDGEEGEECDTEGCEGEVGGVASLHVSFYSRLWGGENSPVDNDGNILRTPWIREIRIDVAAR